MTFPLNMEKTHVLFMHHLEQYFRASPGQTPVPYFHNGFFVTWQPTGVSNKTSQTKGSTVSSYHPSPCPSHHLPHSPSEWTTPMAPGSLPPTPGHWTFLELIPFYLCCSCFCSDLYHPFPKSVSIPETLQMALGFHAIQLQPHFNTAARVIFLKQNLTMLLACLESLSSG